MEIELIPRAYKEMEQEYDVRRGYGALHRNARRNFQRAFLLGDTELRREGLIQRPVFTAAECQELCGKFAGGLALRPFDRDLAIALLERIVTPGIDREIISYFESEYLPIHAGFMETPPNDGLGLTDGWHCDGGPSKVLRIMAYFTASEHEGANTLFSDRASTARLKEAGYVFCKISYRVFDLEPITRGLGLERATVLSLDVRAGDVIVFDAPNILHRRLVPKVAPRYVFTTTLVPSMIPWRQVVRAGQLPMSLEDQSWPILPGYAEAVAP